MAFKVQTQKYPSAVFKTAVVSYCLEKDYYFCNILFELFSSRKRKGIPVRHHIGLSHLSHQNTDSYLGMNEKHIG